MMDASDVHVKLTSNFISMALSETILAVIENPAV